MVCDAAVDLTVAHEKVLNDARLSETLPMLISKSAGDMLRETIAGLPGDAGADGAQAALQSSPWRSALEKLRTVTKIIDLGALALPGVTMDGAEQALPVGLALVALDMLVMVADTAVLAVHINASFLVIVEKSGKLAHQDIAFKFAPKNLKEFQISATRLEEILRSDEAFEIERQGWKIWCPVLLVREWQKAMASWGGRVQRRLMEEWVNHLQAAVQVCRLASPAWDACFSNGGHSMDLPMAVRLLSGKAPRVVRAHNKVHEVLTTMASAASTLEVTPALKIHPVTNEAVHVALATMRNSSTTVAVIEGVELLAESETAPNGPARAAAFITAKKQTEEANISASAFWQELDLLAKHGCSVTSPKKLGDCPASSAKAPSSSVPGAAGVAPRQSAQPSGHDGSSAASSAGSVVSTPQKGCARSTSDSAPGVKGLKRLRRS